jgi:hypothetical protein
MTYPPRSFESCYRIYHDDRPAILAVCPDANLDQHFPHGEDVLLGTVREVDEDDGKTYYEVDILIGMLPAHFWTFRVRPGTSDGRACEIGTGSGTFAQYWPMVKAVAEGMLVVKYPQPAETAEGGEWGSRVDAAFHSLHPTRSKPLSPNDRAFYATAYADLDRALRAAFPEIAEDAP